MGRIKTTQIKRTTRELIKLHGQEFTENFQENQKIVNKLISTPSKSLRNKVAGYVTRLVKKSRISE